MNTPDQPNPVPTPNHEEDPARAAESGRTRTGKIARLPKRVRDELNLLILDGAKFADIISRLGLAEKSVTEHNITTWVAGGYKDWLKEQRKLDEVRVKQEVAMDLAAPDGGVKIHQATLQLSATAIADMVRKLDYSEFEELLRVDPAKIIPFMNSLARISDAQLRCERYIQESQPAQPADTRPKGLRPETRREMENVMNLM